MLINADGWNPEEDIGAEWPSERLIGRFKNIVSRATHEEADFIYLRMRQNLHVLRAAVLAVTDQCGLGILAEIPVDEDRRTADDSSALAVMGILQRIGVAGIILGRRTGRTSTTSLKSWRRMRISHSACLLSRTSWIRCSIWKAWNFITRARKMTSSAFCARVPDLRRRQ